MHVNLTPWLCTLSILLCVQLLSPFSARAQDDIAKARQLWEECTALLDDKKPCKALKKCKAGLTVRETSTLKKTTAKAKKACRKKKGGETKKPKPVADDSDGDGLPDNADRCPSEAEDKDGFQDDDGCADIDNDKDGVLDVDESKLCRDSPEDMDGFEDSDGCPDPDNDNDNILDTNDGCPDVAEDVDGFLDDDGCPDLDNDEDGLPDTDESKACRDAPEDKDGFEDDDGCPDPDNDNDGVLDVVDACPNQPEDVDEYQDTDGCPEDNPTTLAPFGWTGIGVGTGLGVTALVLHLLAEGKRAEFTDAERTDSGAILGLKPREALALEEDANSLDTGSAISLGIGGALLTAGVILVVMDALSDDEAPPAIAPAWNPKTGVFSIVGRF